MTSTLKPMLRANIVILSRSEALVKLKAGTLPRGHATLNELTDATKTVYHIIGTPKHHYLIERSSGNLWEGKHK